MTKQDTRTEKDPLLFSQQLPDQVEDEANRKAKVGLLEWCLCWTWERITGREAYPAPELDFQHLAADLEHGYKRTELDDPKLEKLDEWYREARQQWPKRIPQRRFDWHQMGNLAIRVSLIETERVIAGGEKSARVAPSRVLQFVWIPGLCILAEVVFLVGFLVLLQICASVGL